MTPARGAVVQDWVQSLNHPQAKDRLLTVQQMRKGTRCYLQADKTLEGTGAPEIGFLDGFLFGFLIHRHKLYITKGMQHRTTQIGTRTKTREGRRQRVWAGPLSRDVVLRAVGASARLSRQTPCLPRRKQGQAEIQKQSVSCSPRLSGSPSSMPFRISSTACPGAHSPRHSLPLPARDSLRRR